MATTFLEPKKKYPWNKGLKTGLVPKTAFKKGEHPSSKTEFKKGVSASPDTQFKKGRGEQQKGKLNPNWKDGASTQNMLIRKSLEYRLWRIAVLTRDNNTCIWCGSKEKIQADHIKKFAHYPELRFAIDNGRTLCESCHKTTENYGNKGKKIL
jgi:hypothetical protein